MDKAFRIFLFYECKKFDKGTAKFVFGSRKKINEVTYFPYLKQVY